MGRLEGRVAIVTGAAGGLGGGIARRFASEGATVLCADLADASEIAAELEAAGGSAQAVRLDVTDRDGFEAVIADAVREHGKLDILCNNAGVFEIGDIVDASDESFRRSFEINTWAVFISCRAAGRAMREQGYGRIVNVASQLGKVARGGAGVYSASKAAVIALTQALALELAPHGVTANCICPGTMLTPLMSDENGRPAVEIAAEQGTDVETALAAYIEAKIPVGRFGRPSDMGELATWLACEESAFMTGSALNLSGGEQVFF